MKSKFQRLFRNKKSVFSLLDEKVEKCLDSHKLGEASNLLLELDPKTEPEKETPATSNTKITRIKSSPKQYIYQFTFMSKRYRVEFASIDDSNTKYKSTFYVMDSEDSPKVTSRFGISSVSTIEPLFEIILQTIKMFVSLKKPLQVRFLPGEGIQFPSSFHMYIYKPLKAFAQDVARQYAVIRGDSTADGSAFILKKGGQQSNVKTAGWRPGKGSTTKTEIQPEKEEVGAITNVTGDAVQTTIPFKPKKKLSKIERRK